MTSLLPIPALLAQVVFLKIVMVAEVRVVSNPEICGEPVTKQGFDRRVHTLTLVFKAGLISPDRYNTHGIF